MFAAIALHRRCLSLALAHFRVLVGLFQVLQQDIRVIAKIPYIEQNLISHNYMMKQATHFSSHRRAHLDATPALLHGCRAGLGLFATVHEVRHIRAFLSKVHIYRLLALQILHDSFVPQNARTRRVPARTGLNPGSEGANREGRTSATSVIVSRTPDGCI